MYNVKNICAAIALFAIITVSYASEMPVSFIKIKNHPAPGVDKNMYLQIPVIGTYQDIYVAYIKQTKSNNFFLFIEVGRLLRPREEYYSSRIETTLEVITILDSTDFRVPEGASYLLSDNNNVWPFYFQWVNDKDFGNYSLCMDI
jgi:hypothetical protein